MIIWQRIRAEAAMLWAFWSVRLAAAAGMVAAYLVADPTALSSLLVYVPDNWRPAAGVIAGLIVFMLPTLARRMPQAKLRRPTVTGEGK